MQSTGSRETFRFGDFELDTAAYQLRRQGRPVKLGRQPMDLLILLVEARGQLVSRSDIVDRLWGQDVFVDVEMGVNTAISKVRQALRDSPDGPAFLETVSGKGYRFSALVETASSANAPGNSLALPIASAAAGGTTGDSTTDRRSDQLNAAPSAVSPFVPTPVDTSPASRWMPPMSVRFGIGLLVLSMAVGTVAFLSRVDGGPATGVTLAVLPFENLGNDPDRDYLADGLTDETSASLAQVDPEHLSVKGRTLRLKRTTKTVAEIGQELAVDYLVESSIRAEGARLRVSVTLIRVRDQAHVWSRVYDSEPRSLLGWQQELSSDIAEQISLRLSPNRLSDLQNRQTLNADAYDLFLRGRYEAHRRTADGNARAIELLHAAITLDGNYALAWSDLAFAYAQGAINGDARPADVGPRAREAALRAVRANASLPEAQLALGYERWLLGWDWSAADAAFRLAIDLDPSNATAHRLLGHALSQSGRHAEADTAMRRARELDPLDALTRALSAQVAYQARDPAAAKEHARRAIVLNPRLWIGYAELAQAYEAAGEQDLAFEALADAERLAAGNSNIISIRGYMLAKSGRADAAREAVKALDAIARERYVPPFATALVYAGLGERNAMFERLERAYAAGDVHLIYLPVDQKWDPFRTDPRFVDLVARCGFASSSR